MRFSKVVSDEAPVHKGGFRLAFIQVDLYSSRSDRIFFKILKLFYSVTMVSSLRSVSEAVKDLSQVKKIRVYEDQVRIYSGFLTFDDGFKE